MQNKFSFSRRAALLGAAFSSAAIFLPSVAFAIDAKDAGRLIGVMVGDINGIINSGKSEPSMYKDFEGVFKKYGDTMVIARSALGVTWRSASASQQRDFTKAFEGYMARKWGKRFREFIGGTIVVTGSKEVKTGYLVSSTVKLKGSAPFLVEWQVYEKNGVQKMFNVYIEGINMLATERTEIGAMLDRRGGNLSKLISDLKKAG